MKKLLFVLLTFITLTFSFAQVQSIKELSTGVLEQSSRLNDTDGNVIGYAFIFNKGLIKEDKFVQYEYVLIDSNLNKITNGDFELRNITKSIYSFTGIEFLKQKLYINSKLYHAKSFGEYGNVLIKLDLKTNKTEDVKFYRNGSFTSFSEVESFDKMKFLNTSMYSSNIFKTYKDENQLYYFEIENINYNNKLVSINVYNEKFENTFSYVIDKVLKKQGYEFSIEALKDDSLLILQRKYNDESSIKTLVVERLLGYNITNGEKFFNVIYNQKFKEKGNYAFPKIEFQDDRILVIGELKETNDGNAPSTNTGPNIGLIRSIYDTSGNLILEKQSNYNFIFQDLGFKSVRDKDGYKFVIKEYFNYKDNSFTVLLEKQKGDNSFTVIRSTDYIIANFDSNGNFKNHIVLEKSKQKMFDSYLFSQENKAENEVLFFYSEQDQADKKVWNLIINKLKNGVLTQDKMPFKTKETSMRFGKAKYGYIFISEYNKDEKESSVRIEKLNL